MASLEGEMMLPSVVSWMVSKARTVADEQMARVAAPVRATLAETSGLTGLAKMAWTVLLEKCDAVLTAAADYHDRDHWRSTSQLPRRCQ